MIIQAELKCKQTGCEAGPCAVDSMTYALLKLTVSTRFLAKVLYKQLFDL